MPNLRVKDGRFLPETQERMQDCAQYVVIDCGNDPVVVAGQMKELGALGLFGKADLYWRGRRSRRSTAPPPKGYFLYYPLR